MYAHAGLYTEEGGSPTLSLSSPLKSANTTISIHVHIHVDSKKVCFMSSLVPRPSCCVLRMRMKTRLQKFSPLRKKPVCNPDMYMYMHVHVYM